LTDTPLKKFYRQARALLNGVGWQLILALAAAFGLQS